MCEENMLIETELGLAFVQQSQSCPRGVCGQLQKLWFGILFCFTAEDSIYVLTARVIPTRDCTSQGEILGVRSHLIFPLFLRPSQTPRAFWAAPLAKEEVLLSQLLKIREASALCRSCRLLFHPCAVEMSPVKKDC